MVQQGDVKLNFGDATLNAMPVCGGKVLMALTEGGMQYLLASARCSAGIKSGRYMFEVRILETLTPCETQGSFRVSGPRNVVRIGFSLAGSSLFLGDGESSNFCFDSEGYFLHGWDRKKISQKFVRDQTVAILLNLDSSMPNANTVTCLLCSKLCSVQVPILMQ